MPSAVEGCFVVGSEWEIAREGREEAYNKLPTNTSSLTLISISR